jgi:hypothetical protein
MLEIMLIKMGASKNNPKMGIEIFSFLMDKEPNRKNISKELIRVNS